MLKSLVRTQVDPQNMIGKLIKYENVWYVNYVHTDFFIEYTNTLYPVLNEDVRLKELENREVEFILVEDRAKIIL